MLPRIALLLLTVVAVVAGADPNARETALLLAVGDVGPDYARVGYECRPAVRAELCDSAVDVRVFRLPTYESDGGTGTGEAVRLPAGERVRVRPDRRFRVAEVTGLQAGQYYRVEFGAFSPPETVTFYTFGTAPVSVAGPGAGSGAVSSPVRRLAFESCNRYT
jgi:hypothetical protein